MLALALLFVFLLVPAQGGLAQEPTPATPTDEFVVTETETSVPEQEASPQPRYSGQVSRILVKITPQARIFSVVERAKGLGQVLQREELSKLGVFVVEVPVEEYETRKSQLLNVSGVAAVEPEQWVSATDTFPNDPGLANQYGLAAIRAPQGWDLATGSNSVVIAIVDSGVDYGHTDLSGKLTAGHNFVACPNSALPCAFLPQDDYGHGTHAAGIAAALTNNSTGVAGVSWGARVMPIKVLNSFGNGTYENVAAGIVWAVDHGAQIINLSLGGINPSAVLESAVQYAYSNNVLMVASSGNQGSSSVLYPARYPQVVAVGASNMNNLPANFSNYGPEVDLAAPGENIYSTWIGNSYQYRTGTSMSAPYVSGLAAVLFSYISGADAVRGVMESTALDIGPTGWDDYSGAGLIQMDAALALVVPPTPTSLPSGQDGGGGAGVVFGNLPTSTLTFTPPALLTPVTATQSTSTLTVESLTLTPTQSTISTVPAHADPPERWKVFLTPVFCGAIVMILVGVGLFWLVRRRIP
jgi:thermitase